MQKEGQKEPGLRWDHVLIAIGIVMYLLVFPHGIYGDASVRYWSMLGSFSAGRLLPMIYSYVHPLVSAPLLLLGYVAKDGYWWISRFNTFLFFAFLAFTARAARGWEGWSAADGRRLLLLFMGATMFPKHVTDYYAEVFSSVLAFSAVLLFQRGNWKLAVLAVCLSVWNMIGSVVAGAALLAFFALRSRRWRFLAALPLLPLGFALENYLKSGDFYPTRYVALLVGPQNMLPYSQGPGFSYPLFFGLLNVFLSFGRGLVFFAPGLLLLFHPALWWGGGKARELLWGCVAYLAGLVLVYAKYWCWHGAAFWGPRFFLFASLPAALALALLAKEERLSLPWRWCWAGAVALSCWVGCQGVLFGTDFTENCFSRGHELEFACWYTPEYSVLWRFFIVGPPVTGRKVAFLCYFLLVAGTLLWPALSRLLKDTALQARQAWKARGPGSGWRA